MNIRKNNGITIVSLIITIIVLLIIATITVKSINDNKIILYAQNSAKVFRNSESTEQNTIIKYENEIEKNIIQNKTIVDMYGNKIVVPYGFRICVDSTVDYTEDELDVTKGIVVQDEQKNQFVWVPVGVIYTNKDKTESKTIELGRYSNFSLQNEKYVPAQKAEDFAKSVSIGERKYIEDTKATKDNIVAKNLEEFCNNTLKNGGFYIARYEARVVGYDKTATSVNAKPEDKSGVEVSWTQYVTADGKDPQIAIRANETVWNQITQKKAAEISQKMYEKNELYSSDLVNSYAWDTALIFIQTFGNSDFAEKEGEGKLSVTGASVLSDGNVDRQLNIYDMAGNYYEWSTETGNYSESRPYTYRGGVYYRVGYGKAGSRSYLNRGDSWYTFRPIIYFK